MKHLLGGYKTIALSVVLDIIVVLFGEFGIVVLFVGPVVVLGAGGTRTGILVHGTPTPPK